MPKTTTPPTADELRAQAEQLDAQANELREELRRQAEEAAQRRYEAELAFDEEFVAAYSAAALEADVDRAKAALADELATNPLVAALANYGAAMRRRSHGQLEHISALNRLGRQTPQVRVMQTDLSPLNDYLIPAAEQAAAAMVAEEMAELHARRQAAGDAAEGQGR